MENSSQSFILRRIRSTHSFHQGGRKTSLSCGIVVMRDSKCLLHCDSKILAPVELWAFISVSSEEPSFARTSLCPKLSATTRWSKAASTSLQHHSPSCGLFPFPDEDHLDSRNWNETLASFAMPNAMPASHWEKPSVRSLARPCSFRFPLNQSRGLQALRCASLENESWHEAFNSKVEVFDLKKSRSWHAPFLHGKRRSIWVYSG